MNNSKSKFGILILWGLLLAPVLLAQGKFYSEEYHFWDVTGAKYTEPIDCIRVSDTSFIVLARTAPNWPFGSETTPVIACYTVDGQQLWRMHLGLGKQLFLDPSGILPTPDGWKIIGMGYPDQYTNPSGDRVAMRTYINNLGYFVQSKQFPSGELPEISGITIFDDYRYAVSTATAGITRVNFYSSEDRLRWYHSFEPEDPTIFYGLNRTNNGIIMSGRAIPNDTNSKAYTILARLTASGDLEWTRTFRSSAHEYNTGVASLADGTILTYGFQRTSPLNYYSALTIRWISSTGDSLMSIQDRHSAGPIPTDLIQRGNGEILLSWIGGDSGYVGHMSVYEGPEIDEMVLSGPIAPEKLLHLNDNTVVILDRRATLNSTQTSLEELFTRVIVLTRQNTLGVHEIWEHQLFRKMDLR